jgi:hypothetical protein
MSFQPKTLAHFGLILFTFLGVSCKTRLATKSVREKSTVKNFERNNDGTFEISWKCHTKNSPMLKRETLVKTTERTAFLSRFESGVNKGNASCEPAGKEPYVLCTEQILTKTQIEILKAKHPGFHDDFKKQDEYCEWDIRKRNTVAEPLKCRFSASFDTGRSIFLNQRENEEWFTSQNFTEEEKEAHRDLALALRTVTNTYPALVGNEEPMSLTKGIFADAAQLFKMPDGTLKNAKCSECTTLPTQEERFACENRVPPYVPCGADRQSDPLIIDSVQNLLFNQQCKTVDVRYTNPIVSASHPEDPVYAENKIPLPHDLNAFFDIVNKTPAKIPFKEVKMLPRKIPNGLLATLKPLSNEQEVTVAHAIDYAAYNSSQKRPDPFVWNKKGDTRYKFELRIGLDLEEEGFCKHSINEKLGSKQSESDLTQVDCEIPANKRPEILTCDQVAAEIINVAKGTATQCKAP